LPVCNPSICHDLLKQGIYPETIQQLFKLIFLVIFNTLKYMTAQAHERLILPEGEVSMITLPDIPLDNEMIETVAVEEVVTLIRENKIQSSVFSTACWRKYIGTWEIRDNKLYLVSIEGIFRLNSDTPIFADWYSGTLNIPRGNCSKYIHMGFESVYERYTLISVERGIVIDYKDIVPELTDNSLIPEDPYT